MRINIASGNDRVAVQVGRVTGSTEERPDRDDEQPAETGGGTVKNIRTGNAKVGLQVDEFTGDIVIGRRKK